MNAEQLDQIIKDASHKIIMHASMRHMNLMNQFTVEDIIREAIQKASEPSEMPGNNADQAQLNKATDEVKERRGEDE